VEAKAFFRPNVRFPNLMGGVKALAGLRLKAPLLKASLQIPRKELRL
jgi:hypothetical protein